MKTVSNHVAVTISKLQVAPIDPKRSNAPARPSESPQSPMRATSTPLISHCDGAGECPSGARTSGTARQPVPTYPSDRDRAFWASEIARRVWEGPHFCLGIRAIYSQFIEHGRGSTRN